MLRSITKVYLAHLKTNVIMYKHTIIAYACGIDNIMMSKPESKTELVWLKDANVPFLQS